MHNSLNMVTSYDLRSRLAEIGLTAEDAAGASDADAHEILIALGWRVVRGNAVERFQLRCLQIAEVDQRSRGLRAA